MSRSAYIPLPVRWALMATGIIGDAVISRVSRVLQLTSSVLLIGVLAVRPSTWRPTITDAVVRQCYFSGVQALRFVTILAVLVGLGLVTQVLYWSALAGQSEYAGLFVTLIFVRELAPLLAALILIGRSGTAIVAEIGSMRVSGSVELLESSGIDPILYLGVPRAIGGALSVAGLTVWMIVVTMLTGYLAAGALSATNLTAGQFMNQVLGALDGWAYLGVFIKTTLSGWVIGIICTLHGFECGTSALNVPRLLPRCFVECLLATFLISGAVTLVL
ncbi:ABC transporter permease [Planctomycetales bacterium ZRK34]|nr:ABC transporter permease [Planctomycetales bacterium ZRK34]